MGIVMQTIVSAVGGIALKMLMGVITNPKFLQDSFLFLANKLVKATPTDVDDKLLALAEEALAVQAEKAPTKQ